MTTRTAEHPVAAPAEPRQRPGWGPLLVMLTGTFMTFLDSDNASVNVRNPLDMTRGREGYPRPWNVAH